MWFVVENLHFYFTKLDYFWFMMKSLFRTGSQLYQTLSCQLLFSFEVLPVPLLSGAAEAEVSSACKENDEEKSEGEDEETLYLNPLKGKIKSVAEDFTMAVNQ